ncbi:MAG: diacylglycerol kinase family protein, partial [Clostridia bacterium]|nr:diacylglycerol kinase family protein [Clostridia bacterium]
KMKNKSFLKSVRHAGEGFMSALKTERNLRIDLVIADLVLIFAYAYKLSAAGYAVLIAVICAVMCAELFNTAMEYICDEVTEEYSEKIKFAKDISAAAVFVTAIGAVIAGIALFLTDTERLLSALLRIAFSPTALAAIAVTLIIGTVFVIKYK